MLTRETPRQRILDGPSNHKKKQVIALFHPAAQPSITALHTSALLYDRVTTLFPGEHFGRAMTLARSHKLRPSLLDESEVSRYLWEILQFADNMKAFRDAGLLVVDPEHEHLLEALPSVESCRSRWKAKILEIWNSIKVEAGFDENVENRAQFYWARGYPEELRNYLISICAMPTRHGRTLNSFFKMVDTVETYEYWTSVKSTFPSDSLTASTRGALGSLRALLCAPAHRLAARRLRVLEGAIEEFKLEVDKHYEHLRENQNLPIISEDPVVVIESLRATSDRLKSLQQLIGDQSSGVEDQHPFVRFFDGSLFIDPEMNQDQGFDFARDVVECALPDLRFRGLDEVLECRLKLRAELEEFRIAMADLGHRINSVDDPALRDELTQKEVKNLIAGARSVSRKLETSKDRLLAGLWGNMGGGVSIALVIAQLVKSASLPPLAIAGLAAGFAVSLREKEIQRREILEEANLERGQLYLAKMPWKRVS